MLNQFLFRLRDLAAGVRPDLAPLLATYVDRLQALSWEALELDGHQAVAEALEDASVQRFLAAVEHRWLNRIIRADARPDFHAAVGKEFELAVHDAYSETGFIAKGFIMAKGMRLQPHLEKLKAAHEQALAAVRP